MYEEGKGVDPDYVEAVKWLRKSAEQGDARGQCKLGVMYYEGIGVSSNRETAIEWYRKAAKQGNKDAIGNLKQPGESY